MKTKIIERTAWTKIVEKKGQISQLRKEINLLKQKAVLELRRLGCSHDEICRILSIGKINSIKFSKRMMEK